MLYFLKQHFLLSIILLLTVHANGQFTQSKTCIGGTGNELIYPKYFGGKSTDYNFKLNDGGSMYFLFSNSADGDFAPNKGYNDLVALKINSNGELAFAKNFGNAYYEDDFVIKQSQFRHLYKMPETFFCNNFIGDRKLKVNGLFCKHRRPAIKIFNVLPLHFIWPQVFKQKVHFCKAVADRCA